MNEDDHGNFIDPYSVETAENTTPIIFADGVLRPGGLQLTKRIVECCTFPRGAKVVDIGCGTGATVEYLRGICGLDAVGVDSSAVLLERGKSRLIEMPLILSSGEALPFASGSIDGAISECSLSVMGDVDKALAEINRILVPGGKLAIADIYVRKPDDVAALRGMACTGCISGAMTQAELAHKLADYGFNLTIWEDQSNCLKEFMARLIWESDALDEFWQNVLFGQNGKQTCQPIMNKAALGYFWLVAEKRM